MKFEEDVIKKDENIDEATKVNEAVQAEEIEETEDTEQNEKNNGFEKSYEYEEAEQAEVGGNIEQIQTDRESEQSVHIDECEAFARGETPVENRSTGEIDAITAREIEKLADEIFGEPQFDSSEFLTGTSESGQAQDEFESFDETDTIDECEEEQLAAALDAIATFDAAQFLHYSVKKKPEEISEPEEVIEEAEEISEPEEVTEEAEEISEPEEVTEEAEEISEPEEVTEEAEEILEPEEVIEEAEEISEPEEVTEEAEEISELEEVTEEAEEISEPEEVIEEAEEISELDGVTEEAEEISEPEEVIEEAEEISAPEEVIEEAEEISEPEEVTEEAEETPDRDKKKISMPRKIIVALVSMIAMVMLILAVGYGVFVHYYNKLNHQALRDKYDIVSQIDLDEDYDENAQDSPAEDIANLDKYVLGNLVEGTEELKFDDENVTNILLIGTDNRSKSSKNSRSDSMIIASINRNTKKIVMTSVMRDTYVNISGVGNNRINAAYAYGGPELLISTIEKNFKISLDKYVQVDFYSFMDIVDALNGVTLDVSDAEIEVMNDYISGLNQCLGLRKDLDKINESDAGVINLNGKQAVAYSRVRYVGNADFGRTERQRKVLAEIFKTAKGMSVGEINNFANVALPSITTNLTQGEVLSLVVNSPEYLTYDLVSARMPLDGSYKYMTINKMSVLGVDFAENRNYWYETVYGSGE